MLERRQSSLMKRTNGTASKTVSFATIRGPAENASLRVAKVCLEMEQKKAAAPAATERLLREASLCNIDPRDGVERHPTQ